MTIVHRNLFLAGGLLVLMGGAATSARADQPVVVYVGTAAIESNQFQVGMRVAEGIAVSAPTALTKEPLFIGFLDGDLRSASLLRLDMAVNAGLLQIGEVVKNPALAAAHRGRSTGFLRIWPTTNEENIGSMATTSAPIAASTSSGPFTVEIDGNPLTTAPVVLKTRLNKSKCTITLIRLSEEPLWQYELEMEAAPSLSFMKPGRRTGLNEVPTKIFRSSQQSFFKPWTHGSRMTIPVEIYYMKTDAYDFTLRIKTKAGSTEEHFKVRFES